MISSIPKLNNKIRFHFDGAGLWGLQIWVEGVEGWFAGGFGLAASTRWSWRDDAVVVENQEKKLINNLTEPLRFLTEIGKDDVNETFKIFFKG